MGPALPTQCWSLSPRPLQISTRSGCPWAANCKGHIFQGGRVFTALMRRLSTENHMATGPPSGMGQSCHRDPQQCAPGAAGAARRESQAGASSPPGLAGCQARAAPGDTGHFPQWPCSAALAVMEGTRLKINGANWEAGPRRRRRLGTHHLEPEQFGFFSSSLHTHSSVSAQNDARRSKEDRRCGNCWASSGVSRLLPATQPRVTAVSPDNDCKKILAWQGVPAESEAGI